MPKAGSFEKKICIVTGKWGVEIETIDNKTCNLWTIPHKKRKIYYDAYKYNIPSTCIFIRSTCYCTIKSCPYTRSLAGLS